MKQVKNIFKIQKNKNITHFYTYQKNSGAPFFHGLPEFYPLTTVKDRIITVLLIFFTLICII